MDSVLFPIATAVALVYFLYRGVKNEVAVRKWNSWNIRYGNR